MVDCFESGRVKTKRSRWTLVTLRVLRENSLFIYLSLPSSLAKLSSVFQPPHILSCSGVTMTPMRHSIDIVTAPLPSPLFKERFCRSSRIGTRPSTFSTVSFLGTQRSPRFYEKLCRWFKQKRGKDFAVNDAFPTEKHSNAHHNTVIKLAASRTASNSPALAPRNIRNFSSPRHHPRLIQSSLTATLSVSSEGQGSLRSLTKTVDRLSPLSAKGCGRLPLSSTASTGSAGSAQVLNPNRGISIESGYYSFSTCSSPPVSLGQSSPSIFKRERTSRFRFLTRAFKAAVKNGKSLSEEIPESTGEENFLWQSRSHEDDMADGRRRKFLSKASAFHSAVDEVDDDDLRSESRTSSNCDSSVFSDSMSSLPQADSHEMVALTLGDFRVKYNELQFKHALSSRTGAEIHTGKCQVWDVNIHSCCPKNDEEVQEWLADVRRLTQIRHENLVLYMGACVEPPKFAIITSLIKAESLYTHMVVQGTRITSLNKLSILRQTANALSYLHCKGIQHGRLSTHNIFLETTVKVSLLDYTPSLLNLQYLSPELACTLTSPTNAPAKTKEGDVFAFGSVIYQLLTQRLPLDNLPAQAVLYLVGRGDLITHLGPNLNPGLARMIERCWNPKAELRPSFPALCNLLQPLASSIGARKHSISEPRSLDKVGHAGRQTLFNVEQKAI